MRHKDVRLMVKGGGERSGGSWIREREHKKHNIHTNSYHLKLRLRLGLWYCLRFCHCLKLWVRLGLRLKLR